MQKNWNQNKTYYIIPVYGQDNSYIAIYNKCNKIVEKIDVKDNQKYILENIIWIDENTIFVCDEIFKVNIKPKIYVVCKVVKKETYIMGNFEYLNLAYDFLNDFFMDNKIDYEIEEDDIGEIFVSNNIIYFIREKFE
jgi:hypothetical protein